MLQFLHLTLQAFCSNACPEQALRVERVCTCALFSQKSYLQDVRNLKFEAVFEGSFEVVNFVEIVDRICGLCAHPLVSYHQINNLA